MQYITTDEKIQKKQKIFKKKFLPKNLQVTKK